MFSPLQVKARLLGQTHLPWESQLRPDTKQKLGAFREPVLQLLQRDPSQRMPMHDFHAACIRVFAQQTTTDVTALETVDGDR